MILQSETWGVGIGDLSYNHKKNNCKGDMEETGRAVEVEGKVDGKGKWWGVKG